MNKELRTNNSQKTTLPLTGMDCTSCARIIEKTLTKNGINCQVNYATNELVINSPSQIHNLPATINNLISPLGYSVSSAPRTNHLTPNTLFPLSLFTLIFMSYETLTDYLPNLPKVPFSMEVHKIFFLTTSTLVLLFFGFKYLRAIYNFATRFIANMDTLVGLGTFTAYFYSLYNFFYSGNLYFDVPIVIIGFIEYGKYLESNSKKQTTAAIEKLLNLSAKVAIRETKKGTEEISLSAIQVGDILQVKPGEKIPTDGTIIEGNSSLDESFLSGESLPVDKQKGDSVIGSTINLQGFLRVKATKVGEDTLLSKIIETVKEASNSKAPIEKITDQIASYFVPAILFLALLSFAIWFFLGNTNQAFASLVGILVVACPCALGLATPTALVTAIGKGAEKGILIKNAQSLELLHKIDTLVFDKTGTLTSGKPQLIETFSLLPESEAISLAYTLEKHSAHPLATAFKPPQPALSREGGRQAGRVSSFKNLPGLGLSATIDKNKYLLGNEKLIKKINPKLKPTSLGSYLYLSKNDEHLATFVVSDTLKDNAKETIEKLKLQNITPYLLSGDNEKNTQNIANQLEIKNFEGDTKPQDKLEVINKLQKQNHLVAMAGDGVNDAPALAGADVSIAMSTGSDIAIDQSHLTILHGDLSKVLSAIALSKKTYQVIKQNLFWAFFYNLLALPIAAGILLPLFGITLNPAIAGAAMAFSSVSVVTNSLRLKTLKL